MLKRSGSGIDPCRTPLSTGLQVNTTATIDQYFLSSSSQMVLDSSLFHGQWNQRVVVQKLPSELLKFAINAVQDTLPHNGNLAVWRKREGLSSWCQLCGERQTLLRVLNNCPKALNMRRYSEWHDAVLKVICKLLARNLPERYQLLADLPQFQPYVFPPHIITTDQCPDRVVWSKTSQKVRVSKLTM